MQKTLQDTLIDFLTAVSLNKPTPFADTSPLVQHYTKLIAKEVIVHLNNDTLEEYLKGFTNQDQ